MRILALTLALVCVGLCVAVSEYNERDIALTKLTFPDVPEASLNKLKKAGLVKTQELTDEDIEHYHFSSPSFLSTKAKLKSEDEEEEDQAEETEQEEEQAEEDQEQSEEEQEEVEEETEQEEEEEVDEEQLESFYNSLNPEQQASLLETLSQQQDQEEEEEEEAEAEEGMFEEQQEGEQYDQGMMEQDENEDAYDRFQQLETEDRDAVMARHRDRLNAFRALQEQRESMGSSVSLGDAISDSVNAGDAQLTVSDLDKIDINKIDISTLGFTNSKDLLGGYDGNMLPPNALPTLSGNAMQYYNTPADPRFAPLPPITHSRQPAASVPSLAASPMGYVFANSPRPPLPPSQPANYMPYFSMHGSQPVWPAHVDTPAQFYLPVDLPTSNI